MVHIILSAAFSGFRHRLRCLALGANEKNAATLSNSVTNLDQCLMKQRNRFRQVHDVDARTIAVDIRLHLRVPAVGLVTKVDASLKQLTHGEFRQCHI